MSERVRIHLQPRGETFEVARGASLQDVLFPHGVEFPCGGEGYCKGCRVRVLNGTLPVTKEQGEALSEAELADGWRLACCARAESDLTLEIGRWTETILADDSTFAFTPREGYGIAVDVGTTTLAAQVLDLRTARVLAVETGLNPQGVRGSDIMSRVQYGCSPEGLAELREIIRTAIGAMVEGLLAAAGLPADAVTRVSLVGNTVMHHLFCGIDVTPLSAYPFEPPELGLRTMSPRSLGWNLPNAMVQFLPCPGGFVGSDILAGILATRMHESDRLVGLVDLGTNGEIVIGDRRRLLCASTAAGPAFEGARISMGMRATTGAIYEVRAGADGLDCRVIGGGEPRGLCGSGLVDAVAVAVERGWIRRQGRFADGVGEIRLAGPVRLTQKDVRELQLAKGAIAAGVRLLLAQWGATLEDLTALYLAGAFGNYINRASARRIGLLECPPERVHPVGNTALLGAKVSLFLESLGAADLPEIRSRIEHVQLAADVKFQEAYVEAMLFPG